MRARAFAAALLLSVGVGPAPAAELPPLDGDAFVALCVEMYAARDSAAGWPAAPRGDGHHCTLGTETAAPAVMSGDDYAWALRKSLTFACKGRRQVIYEVLRRLRHCDGETRTLLMTPAPAGACRVRFAETGESFVVAPPLIADLVDWRDRMPWYERVLVNLFAPRELPMVMDGLIDCSKAP